MIKRVPLILLLLTALASCLAYGALAYDNSPTWTRSVECYAREGYRISLTGDQSVVYVINRSFVVGLSAGDGGKVVEYLPARYGDIVDGIVAHSSGRYVVSIVNGTFLSVYDAAGYRSTIFRANSTVDEIVLPKAVEEYAVVYATSDGNITRVDLTSSGTPVVKWSTRMPSKIKAVDCDGSFTRILVGSDDGTLALVSPADGKIVKSVKLDSSITSLKVSGFGFFASVTTESSLYVFRTDTLYALETETFPGTQCTSSTISDDGGRVALGLGNGTILYFKPLTEELSKTVVSSSKVKVAGDSGLNYVAWSSEGKVGVTKFMGESLWSYTISTSADVSIAFNSDDPRYLIACTKTRVYTFTRKPFAKLTLNATPKVIGLGGNVTVEGAMEPKLSNQTIKFYAQKGQGNWTEVGWTLTDSMGAFRFTYRPSEAGVLTVKAVWEGDEEFKETSAATTVDVRKPITVEVRALDLNNRPLQNLKVTVNGTRYYTDSSGRIKIETFAGTLNIVAENVSNVTSTLRYRFKVWENNNVAKSQLTTYVDSNTTFTVRYTIECKLSVEAPKYFLYDLSPSSVDQWYENGTKVEIILFPIGSYNTTSTRIVFVGWEGSGPGAYSGPEAKATVKVLGPVYEKILWKRQYKLDVVTAPSTLGLEGVKVNPPSKDLWYDEGAKVEVEAPALVYAGENVRYIFSHLQYGNTLSLSRNISLVLDSPKTVNIAYYVQYYLRVTADIGETEGSGWYNSSQRATFRVLNSTIYVSKGARKVFVEWRGNVSTASPSGQIVLNGPANVHAVFVTQYLLNVTSEHSMVLSRAAQENPSKWYNEGVEVSFYILDLTVDRDFLTYYVFDRWTGDVESGDPTVTVKMVKPYNIVAEWRVEWKTVNVLIVVVIVAAAALLIAYYRKRKGGLKVSKTS